MSDIETVIPQQQPAPKKPKRAAPKPKKPTAKKPAAKAKAKKVAVLKKATKAAKRAAPEEFPETARIYILVDECPRRPGTAAEKHWRLYKNAMTVAQLWDKGGERARLRTDI